MASDSSISDADPVDPRLLKTFSAVITHGSFSDAARELGYTQSAVSQQIASLEGELGVELVRRRPVGPTEAGTRLMDHVASILLRIDAARAEVQRVKGGTTGRLTVGICPLAATAHALRIIGEVARRAGVHELTVRTLPRQAVAEGAATGELDLGLVDGFALSDDPLRPPRVAGLHGVPVCREPVVVALPSHHPLAHRTGLRLADLIDARWIDAPGVSAPWRTCPPWSETAPICGWPCGTTATTCVRTPSCLPEDRAWASSHASRSPGGRTWSASH